ncbi:hypothetical protein MVES1_003280 [Malassezia vespertilionis]|uniref:3-dehydrosphinganine reductase n=1 Tax=Malassezia vespertilionis TaxID=2020962 RepID=A0A2N1J6V6_9BASI|nr:uncharacterized protein MVES1_003280 [Malassezia vespertilionis]PKI82274.1 Tsc10p [Malassezia vespertilionis]WFD07911.1 hypothetical protein MVES1_003280 [Malassezia vespertilionis]
MLLLLVAALCALLSYAMWPRKTWDAKGKSVLITGGSQGLGLALARQLCAQGANIVLCSRTEAKLNEAVQQVKHISYVVADVSTFPGAASAVAQCPFTPDAVFCCAGGAKPGMFLEHTAQDFEASMRTDYMTALATAHASARAMRAAGRSGKIVFVSSVLGLMGMVGYTQYSPMKYAIRGLGECLRSEFQLYGIGVHTYFPATILSPGYEQENKTKPAITKKLEEGDEKKSPEACAACLVRGVERGHFSITDGLIGNFLRVASDGSAPGNGFLVDLASQTFARIALVAWRRFIADRTIRAHGVD